ncbi:cyclin-dependent protein kinase inhibitor SMR3 [Vigna radiata var. radiata]|uniref:Cyclin-dependent protein kinase inhibitor SMR3 n=1 Tax=Vigna radiata var. radiata TaxID=3916 RepID=A0A1S3TE62_VIGRR|nr:cyclin-dependent protein kinase inhibitor SMR3 [Vigna radiata var. radiata]
MSNPEFLTKDDKESDFQILKRPMLEFQTENIETLSSSYSNSRYSQSIKGRDEEREENRQICRVTPSSEEKEKLKEEEDEENDGFKTPTSLDHKILVPSQCPPAPRKTKPSLKRKASCFNHCNCRHPLDLSKEVFELLFPAQQSTKKVRRQDHE